MRGRKIRAVILMLAVLAGCVLPKGEAKAANSWPDRVYADAGSAIVMCQETGTVLYEKNADVQHYPASITKILTALVALEHSSLDEVVTFSQEAVAQSAGGTSSIWRDVGEKMTM
ncbi:MAG: D-alanyl-D-alanine carboxypeptidase, partial [Lachnospiraceae bacterium]|nr:D-alanyl-D-alanine carboxypeptidase [Lachnospiraceae bacterium]